MITFNGIVTEQLADNRYRVQLANGHEIVAYTQDDAPEDMAKPTAGTPITVEIAPTSLNSGQLAFRLRLATT